MRELADRSRTGPVRRATRARFLGWSTALVATAGLLAGPVFAEAVDDYSPHADRSMPDRVFFGDTHLHTTSSPDAFLFGVQLSPDDAFRFAKGERVTSTHGLPVRLIEPLDFLVVSDHMEYLGLMPRLFGGDERVLATEYGRMLYERSKQGEDGFYQAAMILIRDLAMNERKMRVPELEQAIWREVAETADRHDEPGRFTAFTGYEWTSMIEGDNLHRVVVYRGDAQATAKLLPVSSLDSPDPEDLWAFMAKVRGRDGRLDPGDPAQREPQQRADVRDEADRRERLRCRLCEGADPVGAPRRGDPDQGDGETHPYLSPNDEFADYETWDMGNLGGTADKEPSMLEGEYARSALRLGLEVEAETGVNPYRFGMIGSTDSHTALATSREENYFGKHSGMEPTPTRMTDALAQLDDEPVLGWQQVASGLAAVWAEENTRAAIFDAMRRKETYATTGTRMRVRLFAGYDFEAADLTRPDWATHGYERASRWGATSRARHGLRSLAS